MAAMPKREFVFKGSRDNLHADRQPLGRAADRNHRSGRGQHIEPLGVAHGIEVRHVLAVDDSTRARRGAMRECWRPDKAARDASPSPRGSWHASRSSSAHALSSSAAVNRLERASAIEGTRVKMGLSCACLAGGWSARRTSLRIEQKTSTTTCAVAPGSAGGKARLEIRPRARQAPQPAPPRVFPPSLVRGRRLRRIRWCRSVVSSSGRMVRRCE